MQALRRVQYPLSADRKSDKPSFCLGGPVAGPYNYLISIRHAGRRGPRGRARAQEILLANWGGGWWAFCELMLALAPKR
jgi:hypothetical protein